MTIRKATLEDLSALTKMAQILFNEEDEDQLMEEFIAILRSDNDDIFVASQNDELVGFLHMSLRNDYVEGATTYPVAYMEGVFVEPAFRKQDIARSLAAVGEEWAKAKGCTEIASDAELDNTNSQLFHQKIGFEIVNQIVSFIKKVGE